MKRYRDLNSYLREAFGERVQKVSIDAGLSCPNRDGSISRRGCVFCDARGSGTGAFIHDGRSLEEQMTQGMQRLRERYGAKKFIAYFQSFSNTYAPLPTLKALYDRALSFEPVVGLSVATRPDCVDMDVLRLLRSYTDDHMVWIEYGLQSSHDQTLLRINRGHDAACFERAVRMADRCGLNVCAHVILGLPGEDREMMLETADFLAGLPVKGVKIHLLYVVEGTALAEWFEKGAFRCLERVEYAELVVDFLERLPAEVVVQRLTGDPPPSGHVAPAWAREKSKNLSAIREAFERRDGRQGRLVKAENKRTEGR